MLECIRVFVNTPTWEPQHAIIFREYQPHMHAKFGLKLYSFQQRRGILAGWVSSIRDAASDRKDVSILF